MSVVLGRRFVGIILGMAMCWGAVVANGQQPFVSDQPNHSDFAKNWNQLSDYSSALWTEVKSTRNFTISPEEFNLSRWSGNPNIAWTAEAEASRRLDIASAWTLDFALISDAMWKEYARNKNNCDIGCSQRFMNLIATLTNMDFFTSRYVLYMEAKYQRWQVLPNGQIIPNRFAPQDSVRRVLFTTLDKIKGLQVQLKGLVCFIEHTPIMQEGLMRLTFIQPIYPGPRAVGPFCLNCYHKHFVPTPVAAGAYAPPMPAPYFPYYVNPGAGRYFVYNPMLPKRGMVDGYQQPVAPEQFYQSNYGVIAGTQVQAAPAPVGPVYQAQEDWVQTQQQQQQPGVQPGVAATPAPNYGGGQVEQIPPQQPNNYTPAPRIQPPQLSPGQSQGQPQGQPQAGAQQQVLPAPGPNANPKNEWDF